MAEIKKSPKEVIDNFLAALKLLREEKILINNKDFTGQIGEWLVERIYDGQRAKSGIQRDWDVFANSQHIQVKSHAKAHTNFARFSAVEPNAKSIDLLIKIVFTPEYKLKEFYNVPWAEAVSRIKLRGIKSPRYEITWKSIMKFRIKSEDLPKQEIVALFK